MKVGELMTRKVWSCFEADPLSHVAQILWEHDCGCVPVVDAGARIVGVVTDRDALMAAYTQGRPLHEIQASCAMSREIHACRPDDSVESAERTMSRAQVRRLPVEDAAGRLVGLLSLNDIARRAEPMGEIAALDNPGLTVSAVAHTLAAISQPRESEPPPMWAPAPA